jgi:hypothetical protein
MDVRQLVKSTENESFSGATFVLINASRSAILSTHSWGQLPLKTLSGAVIVVQFFQRCTEVLACSSFASKPILKCWFGHTNNSAGGKEDCSCHDWRGK